MSDQLRQLVAEKLPFAVRHDYYGLLGVPPDTPAERLQAPWLALARQLEHQGPLEPELAAERLRVRRAVDEARACLCDPERRREYDQRRLTPAPRRYQRDPHEELRFQQLLETPPERLAGREQELARTLHQRGAALYVRGDLDGAERFYRRALELDPSVPQHHVRLGWVLLTHHALPAERRAAARGHIEAAIHLDPYLSEARYAMALIWKELGHTEHYVSELEAAVRGRPAHAKAEMELAAVRSAERREAERARHIAQLEEAERSRFSLKRLLGFGSGRSR